MTKAVIFDVDGTLIDSVDLHTEAWVEALKHYGIEVSFEDMRPQIGKGGDQLLPLFVPADLLREREEEISSFRSDLFKRKYLPQIRPFPAVPDLFRRIREAGQQIVLASSGKADEVANYARIAGVADLLDEKTTADDAEHSKPAPDIFEAALAKLAPLGPDDTIVVGDTPWDVIAAKRAGLRTVGLLCGGVPEATLREAGALATYRDPQDLLASYDTSPLAA
jgi:beta-phosphoglucomutase-like phosphatase (HAD superfamily)